VDDLPKFVMGGYDYRPLFEQVDDDVLIVEWDIAAGAEHFDALTDLIRANPGEVVAAPYRIYLLPRDPGPHWVMRRFDDAGQTQWVTEADESCHLFGFGMTYIPRDVWRAFDAANKRGWVNDNNFSRWHHEHVRAEVPIPWGVQPVHLHYPIPAFEGGPSWH
jgi:hypothetical protein